ncbi:MAG: hypothetical protein ACK5GI_05160 [Ignavibacteria bacterium]
MIVLPGILFMFLSMQSTMIAQSSWKAILSGTQHEWGNAICLAQNGDVIVVGGTYSNDGDFTQASNGDGDIFFARLSQSGRIVWKKVVNGSERDWAMSVAPVGSDSYVITGETKSEDGAFRGLAKGNRDIFVMKIDGSGDVVWNHTFGGTGDDHGTAVTSLPDGSVIVAGSSNSKDGLMTGLWRGGEDILVFKLRPNGELEWKQVFGGSEDDRAAGLCTDGKLSIYVTGYGSSSNGDFAGLYAGKGDVIVIRQSLLGNKTWVKKFGGSRDDWGQTAAIMKDGGVMVAGETYSTDGVFSRSNRGLSDMFMMHIDSFGQIAWINTLGGSGVDRPLASTITPDNHILITGCTTSDDQDFNGLGRGKEDVFVFNLDQSGQLQWKSIYGGAGFDWGTGIVSTSSSAYLISGYTNSKTGDFISRASVGTLDHDDAVVIRSDVALQDEDASPIRLSDEPVERDAQRVIQRGTTNPVQDFSSSVVVGGSADDVITALASTNDCGSVGIGYSASSDGVLKGMNDGGEDVVFFKTDIAGKVLWRRYYGGSANDRGIAVAAAPDGGFYLTGHTTSSDRTFYSEENQSATGDLETYVIKTDDEGRTLSTVKFGGSKKDLGQAIVANRDGRATIAGNTNSDDGIFQPVAGDDNDVFLATVDAEGSVWWTNTYGGSEDEWVGAMTHAHDSGYVVVGYTRSNDRDFAGMGRGKSDAFVMKLDPHGRKVWARTYGGTGDEWGLSIKQASNHSYVLTGFTTSNDGDFSGQKVGQHDAFVMNVDDKGLVVWKQIIGGTSTDVASAVTVKPTGEIVVTGHTKSNDRSFSGLSQGQEDAFVATLTSKGNLLHLKLVGGSGNDRGIAITSACDTGSVVGIQSSSTSGDFEGSNYGQADMYVLHLNAQGAMTNRPMRK